MGVRRHRPTVFRLVSRFAAVVRALVYLWVLPAALLAARSAGAEGLFLETRSFPYEGTPVSELAPGDLDLDGRSDLVIAGDQAGTGEVHVLLGRPEARFAPHQTLREGGSILAIALGRLDGDEHPDLIVADSGKAGLLVFLGSGNGMLRAPVTYRVGLQPRTVALADFDRDGNLDAATSSLLSAQVDVLLGDGLGALGSSSAVDTGDAAHAMLAGDFDGDLVPDLVVAQTAGVSFLRGLGSGSFANPVVSPAGIPRVMSAGDLNGDGSLDLAIISNPPRRLEVLYNLGGGSFRAEPVDGEDSALQVSTFDIDLDGVEDVVTRVAPDGIRSRAGSSGGTLAAAVDHRLDTAIRGFALSDANGDGAPDLLFTREDAPEVRLSLATARGSLGARRYVDLEEGPQDLVRLRGGAGAVLIAASPRKLHVLEVDRENALVRSGGAEYEGSAFVDALAADFDGDGRDEVALADTGRNRALIVTVDGAGALGRSDSYDLAGFPVKLDAGDLDRDGAIDLVVSDHAHPALTVIRGPVLGGNGDAIELPVPSGQKSVVVADLNGDGVLDLAASLDAGLQLLLGGAGGGFEAETLPELGSSSELRAADLDADGSMDIAGTSGARLEVLLGVASPAGARHIEIPFAADVRALEVVDLDLDGRLDLLTGTRKELQVVRNSGSGLFSAPEEYLGAGGAPRALVVEDFTGDGSLDVAVAAYLSRAIVVVPGLARPAFRRGDTNGDGAVGLTDAIVILDSLFRGAGELPCPDAADADDSGSLDLTDPVYVLLHLFQGGPEPLAPGAADCGADPTSDELGACGWMCRGQ